MLKHIAKFSLPEIEQKVLEFWKSNKIFERSLEKNEKNEKFVFFEGPPTANGRPGIHHVLARSFKDVILRYKTMRGYYVPRKGGWDTHGLPVELEVEKELGLKSKKEIEQYGVSAFNKKCKESVWKYLDEWEKITERMGFWLDLKNAYVTYENSYIETLWYLFKKIWERNLLYKGYKIVPWCPRCGTGLSSHELALGYKEVEENSVYLKFKLKPNQKFGKYKTDNDTYILSWTTTPWTLPGNVALAVGDDINYSVVRMKDELFILASNLIQSVFGKSDVEIVYNDVVGKDLVGLSYTPLFEVEPLKTKTSYKIYPAEFVTTEDGTGVVHTAVMYGEDDYNLGVKVGLPQFHTVNSDGVFVDEVTGFSGMKVKTKESDEKIFDHLKKHKNFFATQPYKHEYPFCWRCGSALLYYARDSWFIKMSELRADLLDENKKINWVPEHLQDGRFGEWIRDVKDWAISRERYWGTPLPIWQCEKCDDEYLFVGGADDMSHAIHKSTNKYIFMRHGEAENNTKHLMSSWPEIEKMQLTMKGRTQVECSAKILKKEKIDFIFSSDLTRTMQTADIVKDTIGVNQVHFDPRLREFDMGDFNGGPYSEYRGYYTNRAEKFVKNTPNGENFTDLRKRLFEFIKETDLKHKNKTILIVTHDACVWMLHAITKGWSTNDQLIEKNKRGEDYIENAGFEKENIKTVPRDETGAFDLHRPYVDMIIFKCKKCGGDMKRIPEVADVWFDSGAMPFAQSHYPFSVKDSKLDYPADYISEAVDQTRGWFYTLLAIGVLLKKGTPFKNVISLGLVLDKNGQKMSKSKSNVISPWDMIEKYGVDAVRWYFYTINPPGEPKRFDEIDLSKTSRQMFSLLYNSFAFANLYADTNTSNSFVFDKNRSILDRWIYARLAYTSKNIADCMDKYDISNSVRALSEFIDDLSRWYIRRSRKRFQKPESEEDHKNASDILWFVLVETSKLLAPFTPFFADSIYQSCPNKKEISVHVENWPKLEIKEDEKLFSLMNEVRRIASISLAKRAEAGIKVRQPLFSVTVKSKVLDFEQNDEFLEILKDEINVKNILFNPKLQEDVVLDVNITHELREEGLFRELIRTIQDLRQEAHLKPKESIVLYIVASKELDSVIKKYEEVLQKEIHAKLIMYKKYDHLDAEFDTKLDEFNLWIGIKKE